MREELAQLYKDTAQIRKLCASQRKLLATQQAALKLQQEKLQREFGFLTHINAEELAFPRQKSQRFNGSVRKMPVTRYRQ